MSQHGRDVQAALGHEIKVMRDGVLALGSLDAKAFEPAMVIFLKFFKVQFRCRLRCRA